MLSLNIFSNFTLLNFGKVNTINEDKTKQNKMKGALRL